MTQRAFLGLALLAAATCLSPAARAAPATPTRVVLAVDGTGETRNLPVLLAERLGYFRDEGLIVTLVDSPAEPSPAELMKDGRADGAVAFYHHTFMSQVDDHMTTQAVVAMGMTPALKLMVAERLRGKVKTLADLKGLRIYAGGPNSGKTTTANWLVIHSGAAIADYTRLANVERDAMAEALRAGKADAIVSHQPDADFYEATGAAFSLADLASVEGTKQALGSVFPSTTLYMPSAYIAAHPEAVQHLVNACLKALAYLNAHTPAEIAAALPPKMVGKDRAAYIRLLSEDKQMFASDGTMPAAAAQAEWQTMTAQLPKYAAVRLADTYTNSFVEHARPTSPR